MRLRYLSDLHFEFHADQGAAFVASLAPRGVDVLVLAGDIAVGEGIGPALDLLCDRFRNSLVLYVHGNHEHYGSRRADVVAITQAACARHSNLRWLDGNEIVEHGGVRFLGAPLWFRHAGELDVLKMAMSDFHRIIGFETWVYEENARHIAWLDRELRTGDVVISHYLPAPACIAPRYENDPLNPFFLCDVEALLRARAPALWIHGHTHESVDTQLGATRILCNPFGYVRLEENAAFREDAEVVIDARASRP